MNEDRRVKMITVSKKPDMVKLRAACNAFADLMGDTIEGPKGYPGVSLDVILSMLAYALHAEPETLGTKLRAMCDALDTGEYVQHEMPRKN